MDDKRFQDSKHLRLKTDFSDEVKMKIVHTIIRLITRTVNLLFRNKNFLLISQNTIFHKVFHQKINIKIT